MGATIREHRMGVISKSLDVASVAANTTAEQDFTVAGLLPGDWVAVNKPGLSAGLNIANSRVKAKDTLSITFGNHTSSAINPDVETYLIFWLRPEALDVSVRT